jgi:MYXO-CTERM domain-containing protein
MRAKRRWLGLSLTAGLLAGCDQYAGEAEDVARVEQAVNICTETVPSNRYVDGIPAYAQCTASQSSPIYSNNGVDTSTTSGGTDWVRTQQSGGYQCTELAHRYLRFHWSITWTPTGNAGTWCNTVPPSTSGVVQTTTPVHGDVIVFPPGSCGADSTAGHVALVDTVNSATQVTIVEQNGANRRNCNISCAACFLHVVANTGTGGSGGASGTGGSATGGTAPATGGRATGGTATGGTTAATGGSTPATGGTATGGMTPSSGGQNAQAGQGTAGTGGEPDPAETCSCRVASNQGGATPRPLGLAALALLGLCRRRRSARS